MPSSWANNLTLYYKRGLNNEPALKPKGAFIQHIVPGSDIRVGQQHCLYATWPLRGGDQLHLRAP
jgi:hypothetical protein